MWRLHRCFYVTHPGLVPSLDNLQLILLSDISRVQGGLGRKYKQVIPNHVDKLPEIM